MSPNTDQGARAPWLWPLLGRLHFYIGLLVGPFLLVAALSGILYALTPQVEQAIYHDQLYTDKAGGSVLPLAVQISIAQHALGDAAEPLAVRPAPEAGQTTRVMFADANLGQWENLAVFVDPVSGEVKGQLPVYGTSGITAFRIVVSKFHRSLLLGDFGRLYSELAASWLWIAALGGLALWFKRQRQKRKAAPGRQAGRWHSRLGPWALVGLLFFSATGLTWSQYAGSNIGKLRAIYGWQTPSVSTSLNDVTPVAKGPHAEHEGPHAEHEGHDMAMMHHHVDLTLYDRVLASARREGISAGKVEIRPAGGPGMAWTVTEIDRQWPTRVDAAAVDPATLTIIDCTRFEDFPLAAKLTRWGVDLHMGVLFGVANQMVLIFFALALVVMLVLGYAMWWRRRPTRTSEAMTPVTLVQALGRAPRPTAIAIVVGSVMLGMALPVLGGSLVVLLLIDALVALSQRRRRTGEQGVHEQTR